MVGPQWSRGCEPAYPFGGVFDPGPWEWSAWITIKVVNPITEAAPAILAFLNGLFPKLINSTTVTQGEAPASQQKLCSQGIIEVTVDAEVLGISIEKTGTQVAGTSDTQGLGFVG